MKVQQRDPAIWKKIDLTKALAWLQRKPINVPKTVPVVLLIKATARSLADFPDLNAIWGKWFAKKKILMLGL
jgi:pyruvate dehydrogenase E2 component (dihydrolipoamide acetyltransferase)